jgi:thioredoxin reductase
MIKSEIGIIGAGPSGIACAIQLKRYGIDYLFFERKNPEQIIFSSSASITYGRILYRLK